jgi:hypothetical protein
MTTLFSELNTDWKPIPQWVDFLIRLGFSWPSAVGGQRRIALVSMPCDSSAAYFIALGALIRDLGHRDATDVFGHYKALLRFARQYLDDCKSCEVRCQPETKRCGYAGEAAGLLRDKNRKQYLVSQCTDFRTNSLKVEIKNGVWQVGPKRALDLQIEGQPRARLADSAGALSAEPYRALLPEAPVVETNLRESYSGLCLAGRATGKAASQKVCAAIRFQNGASEHTLPQLLTIQGWTEQINISRMSFFNCRTEQLDSYALPPALVVADGDTSFLKVLGRKEFQHSDVIGAYDRCIERERLEALAGKLASLRQWYRSDTNAVPGLSPPRGIAMLILARGIE